jgi:hypothetical protein
MNKKIWSLVIINSLFILASFSQELPLGYIIQYSQDFSGKNALADFNFSDPDHWSISRDKQNYYLEFSEKTGYTDSMGRPNMLAIISSHMYSDFIMELDIMPTGEGQVDRSISIVCGLKDTSNYYYIKLASKGGEDSHNVFLVNKEVLTKISANTSIDINLQNNKWHRVKVIRNILEKTITVYFNDMINPVLKAKDRTLIMGYIGFGSAGSAGKIDNINIWAPASVPGDTGIRLTHP